ncbi:MAG: DNA polymerase III subunit alpha [Crocinitomicaceae bacterium]|nr:DNA polymerase III subunit alpha [Crocinitomicaceae bacterium]|tara:strand:- start:85919 stop:90265 length:4347 start_codon:yes stop_codon:yes gene_type:complete
MYIIFDTETTGLPRNWNAPISDVSNWPRVVQIAWQLHNDMGELVEAKDYLIKPNGYNIPYDSEKIHGISTLLAENKGFDLIEVLQEFNISLKKAQFIVGQNVKFDINVLSCEYYRLNLDTHMSNIPILDTCTEVTAKLCEIPGGRGGGFKLPTLTELYSFLFNESFQEAHNATADVEATARCFFELIRSSIFSSDQLGKDEDYIQNFKKNNPSIELVGIKHLNLKEESLKFIQIKDDNNSNIPNKDSVSKELEEYSFAHLHNHTQFSILQSTIDVSALVKKASENNMRAVAITDTGNMMAAFHFEREVANYNMTLKEKKKENDVLDSVEIMPIIGCEFNVCKDMSDKTQKDNGYQVVFLAKNKSGYDNLIKLASLAYTEGMYYVPRIDKSVIEKYCKDIIVLTGNLYGEIPSLLLNVGEVQAEESLIWWKSIFKDDFYIELMRHGQENENHVNESLVKLAKKYGVKLVATNNTYYLNKEDAETHDVLLCVKNNELVSTPKGRGRGFRYGLENEEYYFKSQEEMKNLFLDIPEAIKSIDEIIDKIEHYELARNVLLPDYNIPNEFINKEDSKDGGKRGENKYLRHLAYEGAKFRYKEITDDIRERLDFELETIEKTGYPGYFLIVQDFCKAAREMGVSVGPGRGSAAGSVVAYCIQITNIDPITYDLLFERFLNPDRISMPDIDIDFDDEGRHRVIEWVINKYGANQVAQIITYGSMAAKSSIRDTARVLDLPLSEADRLAKLIPNISLGQLFELDDYGLRNKLKNNQDDLKNVNELKSISNGVNLHAKVINQARKLEGNIRNTGIHACGVIITPDDITKFVPVALAKDSDMYCTQYDNSVAEDAGLLKMDFLGLKTLTLIKHAIRNVKERHDIELLPDNFPIDDKLTYELFQRGETIGIFQYESPGMQKYMRELKPSVFGDLIAMNALYRPGPLEYIPSFIKRKHGDEEIVYDFPECEEYLKETYGITVYQEQVMLLSQKLAGFSKGEADTLRKAMGKKQKYILDKMKPSFLKRGGENGYDIDILEKVWKDWEAFASYAFNKSHSTCYAWIAYQTAYLKANYPAEYMASVLSNNMSDIKQVTFFMDECKRMGIEVLGPDINESKYQFTVNNKGSIRFGLGAIKGIGSSAVELIISDRNKNGFFENVFDFAKRVNLRVCSKKVFESLVYAGGFDSFGNIHRAQYFNEDTNGRSFIENVIRFGSGFQDSKNSTQASLFGESTGIKLPEPLIPKTEEWGNIYALNKEKEVVGFFISGHPLDDFKIEINAFCNGDVEMLNNLTEHKGKKILIPAVITETEHRTTRKGDPFGVMYIEDYRGQTKLFLWRENYLKYKHFLNPGTFISLSGRIEVPYRRSDLEFVINSIDLLSNLKASKASRVDIRISSSVLSEIMVENLFVLFNENKGSSDVNFTVYNHLENIEVRMPSKTFKVDLNNSLFKKLEELKLDYSIK